VVMASSAAATASSTY